MPAFFSGDVTEQADMSVPMYWDRLDTPLPDKPYQDTLRDADKSLKQKEKGSWKNLSKEEKLACWYFFFIVRSPSGPVSFIQYLFILEGKQTNFMWLSIYSFVSP